jgi:predicted  nucleic acid-binding Zn-ribbon protein
VIDPLFWLGLSILLVAASLTAVLVASIPALQELARAARSAEKFFDTLSRELPPTLNAIRNTSLEITDLTDDVSEGVKSAGQVVKQFDQSLNSAKKQAENIQVGTRSVLIGIKAALISFNRKRPAKRSARTLTNQ